MVLYFSATGNTEFIAKHIAKRIGDEAVNLLPRIKEKDFTPITSKKPFIICSPVYVCEMPRFYAEYLRKLPLKGNRRIYFIFTSGGYEGIAGSLVKRLARQKDMIYMGWTGFKMPRNYPVSQRYPMLTDDECRQRLSRACDKLSPVASCIRHGQRLHSRYITQFEKIITIPFNPVWIKYKQPASPFHTTDKCVGCGKCAKLCPLNNISIVERRPVWGNSCAHCMACLGNCPLEAIEYGDRTQGKPKYRISKYVNKKYL